MDQFSISQLSQFSGIKPHTIRIWEQRYNALQPKRSEGNTRYYDGAQLRRLLNIVSLTKANYKVSQLCSMGDEELFRLLEIRYDVATEEDDYNYFVNQLISGGVNYDEYNFEKIFSHCLLRFGLPRTYTKIIYPLLKRVGLMWSTNKMPPAQEHYISNLIKQKLYTSIDSLPTEKEGSETWLLFLPENELHEIGLLFSNYLIRSQGRRVIYLGANVPLSSVESTLEEIEIDKLLLFIVHQDLPENVGEYLTQLVKLSDGRSIFIAANKEMSRKLPRTSPFKWFNSVEDLELELNRDSKPEKV